MFTLHNQKIKKTFAFYFLLIVMVLVWPLFYLSCVDHDKRIVAIPNPEPPPLIGVPAQFGYSVTALSLDGQILIIAGAPSDVVEGVSAGKVYIIDGSTGDIICTIENPIPTSGDKFGFSVAVDKNGIIAVGAPGESDPGVEGIGPIINNAGAVFIFDIYGNHVKTIANPFPEGGDRFGERVAIGTNGNIMIGVMHDDDPDGPGPIPKVKDSGAVFVFDGSTGDLLLTIPSVSGKPWDWFGMDVLAWENRIFIADLYYPGPPMPLGGAVRIFDAVTGDLLDTWVNPFPPPDSSSWDQFGSRLSMDKSGGEIINGSFVDNDPDGPGPIPMVTNTGAVFIHNAEGGVLHTILNPFPDIGDFFGRAVAAENGKYVLAAFNDDDPDGPGPIPSVVDAGTVFVFDAETAGLLHTIRNPYPEVGDFFGFSVAITDGNIIVGAPNNDDPDGSGPITPISNAGSVFVFEAETGEHSLTIKSLGGLIPATNDNFGFAIAMNPDLIVVGAPHDAPDPDGPGGTEPVAGAGSVYVLDKLGLLKTTIRNPAPNVGDRFGSSVAIDKNKIIVGAPSDDDPDGTGPVPGLANAGAVFIFDINGILLTTITDPFPDINNNFGTSLAVDQYGNIIVGASGEDDPDGPGPLPEVTNAGAVYVFDRNGAFLQTIENPYPDTPDNFGASLAVDKLGNIIVGAPNDGDPDGFGPVLTKVEAGAAFVFDGITGKLLHSLYDPDRAPLDQFGASVAVDPKGKIIVGATNKPGGEGGGAVFIFDVKTGAFLSAITNPAPETGDGFGRSLAAFEGKYFIGAPGDNDPDGPGPVPEIISTGAVFIFDPETEELLSIVQNPAPEEGDQFGASVSAFGGDYIIGAAYDDDPDGPGPIPEEWNSGAVFLFRGIGGGTSRSTIKNRIKVL